MAAKNWRKKLSVRLSLLQKQLIFGPSRFPYFILAVLGAIPILVAWIIGVGSDLPASQFNTESVFYQRFETMSQPESVLSGLKNFDRSGFFSRWNWMAYPLLLPASLLLLRYILRGIYERGWKTAGQNDVGLQAIQKRTSDTISGCTILMIAIGLSCVINIADNFVDFRRHLSNGQYLPMLQNADSVEWSWFYLIKDSVTLTEVFFLDVLTTLNQFVLLAIGFAIPVALVRFNCAFLDSIYTRGRANRISGPQFCLKFAQSRFGLGSLYHVFDIQILALGLVAPFMLLSRYSHVSLRQQVAMQDFWSGMWHQFSGSEEDKSGVESVDFTETMQSLFPEIGQWMLMIGWIALFICVMLPARLKLLPLKNSHAKVGALQYLNDFREEGQDISPQDLKKAEKEFRDVGFWPNGDSSAKVLLFGAGIVLSLLIFPVSFKQPGLLAMVITGGTLFAFFSLLYHRLRLYMISPTLCKLPFENLPQLLLKGDK